MDIRGIQSIADRVARGDRNFGRVAVKQNDFFFQLNYTPEAQHSGAFTKTERVCRGLIIRSDGKIMALPMPKFFNLGEPQCPPLPDEPYTVWDKLDGSLGIFWHDGERWRCNTRGSFDNEYTAFGLEFWNREGYGDRGSIPTYWTIMCEICIDKDENPRAAYHPQGIYLIAARDRHSGSDLLIDRVPMRMRKTFRIDKRIDQLVVERETVTGSEGWVVRFESGLRVKIKTAWYLRLFRAMQAMTPRRIREMMVEAGESWVDEFPDDLRADAIKIQEGIEAQYRDGLAQVYAAYTKVARIETRKEYALTVTSEYPSISGWLFKLRDDKFDELEFLKRMRL